MYAETYATDILLPLKDWLGNNITGQNVTNIPLSLANRAQKNIWMLREWQRLFKDTLLTLTNSATTLPADFGRVVSVGSDLAGTGKYDYHYMREGDYGTGYKITGTFDKATGTVLTMTFFTPYDTGTGIYLRYIPIIPDFTGSGTEYTYFPANLIILQAQCIRTLEKGDVKEHQSLKIMFDEALTNYCNLVQNNNAFQALSNIVDRNGQTVGLETYRLDGSSTVGKFSLFENSRRP